MAIRYGAAFRIDLDAFYSRSVDDNGREADYPGGFFQSLDAINVAARVAYEKGGRSSYFLSTEDLR